VDLKFDFSFKTKVSNSFRQKSLIGQYDLPEQGIEQKFKGDYKLPDKWNIGLIVGNSGSGKSSVAKKCFGEIHQLEWNNESIIENFDKSLTMDQITFILGSVGFNSIPYWLKPFSVLSNGEKSRVELARLLAEKEFSIYDEFTSMVDRDVAKSMSFSVQKAARKLNKKLILISCHKDIEEWLEPCWILDMDKNVFFCQKKEKEQKDLYLKFQNVEKKDGISIKNIII